MTLTPKDMSTIENQLNAELVLMKKYSLYATLCTDNQLKQKCEQVASEHLSHYNKLINQLN